MRQLVAGIVVVIVFLCVSSSYLRFSLPTAIQPHCKFGEQLAALAASGLRQNRLRNVSSQLPPPSLSKETLIGHATVFYVWCGVRRRPFEFRNYLSVRSALRVLRPDNVWFYYESKPVVDDKLYNTWWQELIDDVPFLHHRSLREVGDQLPLNACEGPSRPSADFVHALVTSRGGTFVDESTLVVARPSDNAVTVAMNIVDKSDVRLRLLKANRGASCSALSFNGGLRLPQHTIRVLDCPSHSEFTYANSTLCVHVAQSLYPKDIWTLDRDSDRLLRQVFYGRADITLLPSFDSLAPNIGHVIWVGGGEMDFMFYLCVLSLLHVAKVDVVYIHGDRPPTGIYWELLIRSRQNVQLVPREDARQVFMSHTVKLISLRFT